MRASSLVYDLQFSFLDYETPRFLKSINWKNCNTQTSRRWNQKCWYFYILVLFFFNEFVIFRPTKRVITILEHIRRNCQWYQSNIRLDLGKSPRINFLNSRKNLHGRSYRVAHMKDPSLIFSEKWTYLVKNIV